MTRIDAKRIGACHAALIECFLRTSRAPSPADLADLRGLSEDEARQELVALASEHGAVLNPDGTLQAVHPFSAVPTAFRVHGAAREWFACCGWCAMGVAALAPEDVVVKTSVGTEGAPLAFAVRGGELHGDGLIHFPIPMRNAWDDVIATCGAMLCFDTEASIDAWCERHDFRRGDVRTLRAFWPFARAWYGRHASPEWRKTTVAEATALFAEHGLSGDVWELPATGERF